MEKLDYLEFLLTILGPLTHFLENCDELQSDNTRAGIRRKTLCRYYLDWLHHNHLWGAILDAGYSYQDMLPMCPQDRGSCVAGYMAYLCDLAIDCENAQQAASVLAQQLEIEFAGSARNIPPLLEDCRLIIKEAREVRQRCRNLYEKYLDPVMQLPSTNPARVEAENRFLIESFTEFLRWKDQSRAQLYLCVRLGRYERRGTIGNDQHRFRRKYVDPCLDRFDPPSNFREKLR